MTNSGSGNSTAIVTGASRGFGHAVASELARRDWNLIVDSRAQTEIEDAAGFFEGLGTGDVIPLAGDVADRGHASRLVDAAVSSGGFSVLVNNASKLGPSPQPALADYPLDVLRQVFEVNLIAALQMTQLSLPHLRTGGAVINITSDAAVEPYAGWGGYGASKAALEQLSNVLAAEEPAVRVYWFDPGDMRTQMHQEAFPTEDISDRPLPETRVPGLMRLLDEVLPSGRYTAEESLTEVVGT